MKIIDLLKNEYLFLSKDNINQIIINYKSFSKEKRKQIENTLETLIKENQKAFVKNIKSLSFSKEVTLEDVYPFDKTESKKLVSRLKDIDLEKTRNIQKVKQKYEKYKIDNEKKAYLKTNEYLKKLREKEKIERKQTDDILGQMLDQI